MRDRIALTFLVLITLLMTSAWLSAQSASLNDLQKREKQISSQRFERQTWAKPMKGDLLSKRFPIQEWDKHFSPVGSKRAAIRVEGNSGREIFEKRIKEFDVKEFEMSAWNDRMAGLRERAGLSTDERARLVSDEVLFANKLRDAARFTDLSEKGELSLRDINRYQFRRNRSDEGIPRERAGGE